MRSYVSALLIGLLVIFTAITAIAGPPAEPSRFKYNTVTRLLANNIGDSIAFTFAATTDSLFLKPVGDTLYFLPRTFSMFRVGGVPLAIPSLRLYGSTSGYASLSSGATPANVSFTLPQAYGVDYAILRSTAAGVWSLTLLDSNSVLSTSALLRDQSVLLAKIAASGAGTGQVITFNGVNWIPTSTVHSADTLGHVITSSADSIYSATTPRVVINDSLVIPGSGLRVKNTIGTYAVYDTLTQTLWIIGSDTLNDITGIGLTRTAGGRSLIVDTNRFAIYADSVSLGAYTKMNFPVYFRAGSNMNFSRKFDTLIFNSTAAGGGTGDSVGKALGDEAGTRFTTNYLKMVNFIDTLNHYRIVFDTNGTHGMYTASWPFVIKGSSSIRFSPNDQTVDTITASVPPGGIDSIQLAASGVKTVHIANLAITQGKLATALMDSIRAGYNRSTSRWDTVVTKDTNVLVGATVNLLKVTKASAGKVRLTPADASIDTLSFMATRLLAQSPFIGLYIYGPAPTGAVAVKDTLRTSNSPGLDGNLKMLSSSSATGNGSTIWFGNVVGGNIRWNAAIRSGLTSSTDSTQAQLTFLVRNTTLDSSLREAMRITPTGNIGINQATPLARLHVTGKGRFDSTLYVGTYGFSRQLGNPGWFMQYSPSGDTGFWAPLTIVGNAQLDTLGTKDSATLVGTSSTSIFFVKKKSASLTQISGGAGANLELVIGNDTLNELIGTGLTRGGIGNYALRVDTGMIAIFIDSGNHNYFKMNYPVYFKESTGVVFTRRGDTLSFLATGSFAGKADTLGTRIIGKGDTLYSTGSKIVIDDSLVVTGPILQVGAVGSGFMSADTGVISYLIIGTDTLSDMTGYGLFRTTGATALRLDTLTIIAKVDTGTGTFYSMHWPFYIKEGTNGFLQKVGDTLMVGATGGGGSGNGSANFDTAGTSDTNIVYGSSLTALLTVKKMSAGRVRLMPGSLDTLEIVANVILVGNPGVTTIDSLVMNNDTVIDLSGYGLAVTARGLHVDTNEIVAYVDTGNNTFVRMTWPFYLKQDVNTNLNKVGDTITVASAAGGGGTGNGSAKFDTLGTMDTAKLYGAGGSVPLFTVQKMSTGRVRLTSGSYDTLEIWGNVVLVGQPGYMFVDSLILGTDTLKDFTGYGMTVVSRALQVDTTVIGIYADTSGAGNRTLLHFPAYIKQGNGLDLNRVGDTLVVNLANYGASEYVEMTSANITWFPEYYAGRHKYATWPYFDTTGTFVVPDSIPNRRYMMNIFDSGFTAPDTIIWANVTDWTVPNACSLLTVQIEARCDSATIDSLQLWKNGTTKVQTVYVNFSNSSVATATVDFTNYYLAANDKMTLMARLRYRNSSRVMIKHITLERKRT